MMSAFQTATIAPRKTVLFVENDKTIRDSVTVGLEQQGFRTLGVANRLGMRKLRERPHPDIDVMILDINLEDQQSHATGFDVGQEIIDAQPDLPPRIIIYTGHHDTNYYEAAVRMGADDYIAKADHLGRKRLFSRVSTSSLFRALSPVRPEISWRLGQIAEKNLEVGASAAHICQQIIAPEVKACLGVSCIFISSNTKDARILDPQASLSSELPKDWLNIQQKVFEAESNANPFTLSPGDIDSLMKEGNDDLFRRLTGAILVPLYDEGEFHLSMGILATDRAEVVGEQKNTRRYTQNYSRLREPIAKEFKYLAQVKTTIERTKLRHTSSFCLYVGKTQLGALAQSLEKKEITPENACFRRLKRLADDLQATGLEFSRLLEDRSPSEITNPAKISAQTVVNEAWKMLVEQGVVNPERLKITHTGADVYVSIEHADLFLATLRMLEWLAQREDKIDLDASHRAIDVCYERQPGRVAIRFTDHSWQLGERLRRKLFEPFTQGTNTAVEREDKGEPRPGLYLPLYLAKVLLTVKNDGMLEDRTDELDSKKVGNCFVFAFPVEV
jgi:CheY-like chemotaxis protein